MRSITYEDSQLVYEYMLLPIVLTVLNRDLKVLEQSGIKIKHVYTDLITQAMDATTSDLATVKKELRKKGIKVYEESKNDLGIAAKYVCRGWHSESFLIWSMVKYEVEARMKRYLKKR